MIQKSVNEAARVFVTDLIDSVERRVGKKTVLALAATYVPNVSTLSFDGIDLANTQERARITGLIAALLDYVKRSSSLGVADRVADESFVRALRRVHTHTVAKELLTCIPDQYLKRERAHLADTPQRAP